MVHFTKASATKQDEVGNVRSSTDLFPSVKDEIKQNLVLVLVWSQHVQLGPARVHFPARSDFASPLCFEC